MKCQQARSYLSPYLDSELDPTTTYDVSRHLDRCPECAQLYNAEEELERAVAEGLRCPTGDEEHIVERALSRAVDPRGALRNRWGRLTAAASLLLLLGLLTHQMIGSERSFIPELITMAAKDHRRYVRGEVTPEIFTTDRAALTQFLGSRLTGEIGSFPSGDGWELEGARICRFRDMRVGFVTLRYHGIPVSVVDVPEEVAERATADDVTLPPDDRCFELPGGRGILRRTASGLRVAFGDVEMAKLEEAILAGR